MWISKGSEQVDQCGLVKKLNSEHSPQNLIIDCMELTMSVSLNLGFLAIVDLFISSHNIIKKAIKRLYVFMAEIIIEM